MRHQLLELHSRFRNPNALRLAYILLVLLAIAVSGGAPAALGTG